MLRLIGILLSAVVLINQGVLTRGFWDSALNLTPCPASTSPGLTVDAAGHDVGAKIREIGDLTQEQVRGAVVGTFKDLAVFLGAAGEGIQGQPRPAAYADYAAIQTADQAAECAPPPAERFVLVGGPPTLGPTSPGSGPGSWGGYSNGQIPSSALVDVGGGERLEPNAAAAFLAMNAAYKAATGSDIPITDSYRDYAGQVACRAAKGDLCARPGFSNHGWGKALDLGAAARPWVTVNGPRFGWILPAWAQPGGSKPEPWHFEYVGTNTIAAG